MLASTFFECCRSHRSSDKELMTQKDTRRSMVIPRAYYREAKLRGPQIETEVIDLEVFNFIFEYALQNVDYNMETRSKLVLENGEFTSKQIEIFKICSIWRGGFVMNNSEKGSFYLPDVIVMCDIRSVPYPLEFYFIARVEDQLELCSCKHEGNIWWDQLPDHYSTVNDPTIIKKVEDTIVFLKDRVAYDYEQREQEKAERAIVIANRKFLSEKKKKGYRDLTELCMPYSPKKEEVLAFIDGLKEYNDNLEGEEYGTTYDEFRGYLMENYIPFIITLEWDTPVGEIESWISSAVEDNFRKIFEFDRGDKYDENSIADDKGLFRTFDSQLNKIGLQINTIKKNEEYQLIIHSTDVIDEVIKAVKAMKLPLVDLPK